MARARSSLRSSRIRPVRKRISARRGAGTTRQLLNAAAAAENASLTSRSSERGKSPTRSCLLAGLRFSNQAPLFASTQRPPMKLRNFSGMEARESTTRSPHAHGEHDHRQPDPHEALLDREGGLVVEE